MTEWLKREMAKVPRHAPGGPRRPRGGAPVRFPGRGSRAAPGHVWMCMAALSFLAMGVNPSYAAPEALAGASDIVVAQQAVEDDTTQKKKKKILSPSPIKGDEYVFKTLLKAAIAYAIQDSCKKIEPRKIRATMYMLSLGTYLKTSGYSNKDIKHYKGDKEEQEKLRSATMAYLEENGVDPEDPESYCVLGRQEMKKNSQIGKLLKAR